MKRRESFESPFTVVTDGREKCPYQFKLITTDADRGYRPLVVPVEWGYLKSGDYSIRGHELAIAVERKSIEDLFNTLGQHRDRFESEVRRLSFMSSAAIVIEASWATILCSPPPRSRLNPKTILRTAIAWQQRYGVPWLTCEDRQLAEIVTYRWLERWWVDLQERQQKKEEGKKREGVTA